MTETRRAFLRFSAQCLALAVGSSAWPVAFASTRPVLYSARRDRGGQHYCTAYLLHTGYQLHTGYLLHSGHQLRTGHQLDGEQVFATPVPERPHAAVLHPAQSRVLFVARRPGTRSYWLDARNGKLLAVLEARRHRHFYGHGVFDPAGEYLYLTQNDGTDPGRGIIAVYRYHRGQLQFETELPSHGIEPHEVIWLPGAQQLAIAHGGLRSEEDSREVLDLSSMDSSLVLMKPTGELISRETLAESQNSIRHLAACANGTVVCAHQFKGEGVESQPLVAIKRPGEALQTFPIDEMQQLNMQHYCASIAVHSHFNLLAVTSPRGNRVLVWDMENRRNLLDHHLPDCAGIAACDDGFVVTSGQGMGAWLRFNRTGFDVAALPLPAGGWDNHLVLA